MSKFIKLIEISDICLFSCYAVIQSRPSVPPLIDRSCRVLKSAKIIEWQEKVSKNLSFYIYRINQKNGQGGTCENFDRDARVIFLSLKFMKTSFFWVSPNWRHCFGLKNLPSFFWFIENWRQVFRLLNFIFRKL